MGDKHFTGILLALGLVIVAIVLANNSRLASQEVISVTGMAQETVAPDKAEMYITIETTEDTAILSQDRNAELSDSVMQALEAMGVKEAEIETDSYNIYPKEIWNDKASEYKLIGYTVTNSIKITTKDIQNTGKYVDTAIEAGANRIDRVVFSLSDEKEKLVSQDLLQKAGLNAKEKGKSIADSLGLKLGKVVFVSESNYNVQPYYYYSAKAAGMESTRADTQINPNNVEASAYISVSFKI